MLQYNIVCNYDLISHNCNFTWIEFLLWGGNNFPLKTLSGVTREEVQISESISLQFIYFK